VEAHGPIVLNFGQEENKNNTIIHGRAVSASSNQTVMHSQIAISMLDCPLQRSKNIRREQSGPSCSASLLTALMFNDRTCARINKIREIHLGFRRAQ
jgi:hypothetical protein